MYLRFPNSVLELHSPTDDSRLLYKSTYRFTGFEGALKLEVNVEGKDEYKDIKEYKQTDRGDRRYSVSTNKESK